MNAKGTAPSGVAGSPASAPGASASETLKELIERLRNLKTVAQIEGAVASADKPTASKDERKRYLDELKAALERNQHRDAVAIALGMLLAATDDFVATVRKLGLLRASRYGYNVKCLAAVIAAMRGAGARMGVSVTSLGYLESVSNLQWLAPEAGRVRRRIVTTLRARRSVAIKTVLALVNQLFAHYWIADLDASTSRLEAYSSEEVAEALSTLLEIHRKEFGWLQVWQHADDNLVDKLSGAYTALLIDALKLNEYTNAEVLLDGLPYRAVLTSTGEVKISSIDPEFERAVRLGYVQSDVQALIRGTRVNTEAQKRNIPTLRAWVDDAFGRGMDRQFHIREWPRRRIVFELNLNSSIGMMLTSEVLLVEECAALATLDADTFGDGELSEIRLTENLTVRDVLKAQRVFRLIGEGYTRRLADVSVDERPLLAVRSVAPIMKRQQLVEALARVIGQSAAEDFVSLLTLHDGRERIEIQYAPLLAIEDYIAFAPSVVAMSNLVRNLVRGNGLQPIDPPPTDQMQEAVLQALREAGFLAGAEVKPQVQGTPETDIVAWRDGHLFLIECKNAYHPCTTHELRNSYWHLEKGERQLDKRQLALSDPRAQAKLFSQLGWNAAPGATTHTCLVTANRMFSGYKIGQHPVRQARELINVLSSGELSDQDGNVLELFWKGTAFQIDDLIDYLRGGSIVQRQMRAMLPTRETYDFEGKRLTLESFRLDLETLVPQPIRAREATHSEQPAEDRQT